MRYKGNIIRQAKLVLGAIAVSLGMTGCVSDVSDCPSDGDSFDVRLRLNVSVAGKSGTRAAGHELQEALAAEDHIDFDGGDFRLLLFDEDGKFVTEISNSKLIYSMSNTCFLECELLREQMPSDGFSLMLLANWNAYDGNSSYSGKNNLPLNADLGNIWTSEYNFAFQDSGWLPDMTSARKKLIPMFGMVRGRLSDGQKLSDGKTHVPLTIQMLRSIAKVEVNDVINYEGAYISGVEMSTVSAEGRYIPDLSDDTANEWMDSSVQVTVPSLTDDKTTTSPVEFYHFESEKKWVAYIPEMELDGQLSDARPHLNVKVTHVSDGNRVSTHTVHFAQYTEGTPSIPSEDFNRILRNHIYGFDVKFPDVTANLTLSVLPWEAASDEVWDYTDIAGTSRAIEWSQYYPDGLNSALPSVTMNVSDDPGQILVGTFTINSPVSGEWHAYLTRLDAAISNSVVFCNADGTDFEDEALRTHVSGRISNDGVNPAEQKIYIKAGNKGREPESRWRLSFYVYNMDRWIEVNLTEQGTANDTWTIVRPLTDI